MKTHSITFTFEILAINNGQHNLLFIISINAITLILDLIR